MIQRIQTIFLLLTGAAFAALLIYPFATSTTLGQASDSIFADGKYMIMDNLVLEGLAILGIVLAFVGIFLFRKRKTQLKVGYVLIILSIMVPVVAFLYFRSQVASMADTAIEDGIGIFMPVASLLFAILANYFIRKDEKLVKSMDRLR